MPRMYGLFLGAGFSNWAVNLPTANDLFDFKVNIFNRSDERNIEAVKSLKFQWDEEHPKGNNEQFILHASELTEKQRSSVFWHLTRRLAEPFIWKEFQSQRCRAIR